VHEAERYRPSGVINATSALWRGLRLVAPGQAPSTRARGLAGLPGDARADAAAGRLAVSAVRVGGDGLAMLGDKPLDPGEDSASHRLGKLVELALARARPVSWFSVRQRRWFDVGSGIVLSPAEGPVHAGVAWVVRPEAGAAVMPALQSLRPGLRVVYDTLDLHHLRLQRESAVTGSRGLALQARLMKELERRLASGADVAVAISEDEAPLLRSLAGRAEVVVLPNVHEPRADPAPPLDARERLLFVGNFTHTPNVDAVEILAAEVMPRLWAQRPDLELSVAGRGLDGDRPADPRIRFLGWVDDLDALVDRSALLVAPLRFGAGMKGKIGFAIARGLPVVTTAVGAEGFSRHAGIAVVPSGDWDAFAARTLALLADGALWMQASADGIELTREEFAPDVLAERFARVLGPER